MNIKDNSEDINTNSQSFHIGRNAVRELLRSGKCVDKLFVLSGKREGNINELLAKARELKIPIIESDKKKLDRLSESAGCAANSHQGIIAVTSETEYVALEDILSLAEERGEKPIVIIADKIEDPHNLGALIRCAEAAGAHGIIIPKRHSVGVSGAVMKSSAGAAEHFPVCRVANLTDAAKELKKRGLWLVACESGGKDYTELDYRIPCAVVLGSEGSGVSRLLKEECDFLASIPMLGKVNSLNVSCAGAVILYEIIKQRGCHIK